jgi:hypothetical protein
MEARGTVGAYTIGLNYTVRDHTELVAAHYFYASQLKDIPLKGSVQGELVELQGTDGKRIPSSLCRERKQRNLTGKMDARHPRASRESTSGAQHREPRATNVRERDFST